MSTKLKLQRYKKLRALGKTKLTFSEWILPKRLRGNAAAFSANLINSTNIPAALALTGVLSL